MILSHPSSVDPRLRTAGLVPATAYQFYQKQLRGLEQMETTSELGACFMQWKRIILASQLNADYRWEAWRCYTLQQVVYTSCSHDRLTRPEVGVYPNAKCM